MRSFAGFLFLFLFSLNSLAQQECFRPKREKLIDAGVPIGIKMQMSTLYDNEGFLRDTRKEIEHYADDSTCATQLTQIACTIIPRRDFDYDRKKGLYRLNASAPTMAQRNKVCLDERFAKQLAPGTCSCFLSNDNEVTTAGHCFPGASDHQKKTACQNSMIVFGFDAAAARNGYEFKQDQVFNCSGMDKTDGTAHPNKSERLALEKYKNIDIVRVRLDGKASNRSRKPLDISKMKSLPKPAVGDDLCMIGSPLGAPLKMALGEVKALRKMTVKDTSMTVIRSNMDGMAGASGAMVVDCKSGALVGVYLSGAPDLKDKNNEGCMRPIFHDSTKIAEGFHGENILWVGDIPEASYSYGFNGGNSKSFQAPGVK